MMPLEQFSTTSSIIVGRLLDDYWSLREYPRAMRLVKAESAKLAAKLDVPPRRVGVRVRAERVFYTYENAMFASKVPLAGKILGFSEPVPMRVGAILGVYNSERGRITFFGEPTAVTAAHELGHAYHDAHNPDYKANGDHSDDIASCLAHEGDLQDAATRYLTARVGIETYAMLCEFSQEGDSSTIQTSIEALRGLTIPDFTTNLIARLDAGMNLQDAGSATQFELPTVYSLAEIGAHALRAQRAMAHMFNVTPDGIVTSMLHIAPEENAALLKECLEIPIVELTCRTTEATARLSQTMEDAYARARQA